MARSRTERVWLGGAAAAAVLIAVVGWFFLISPERAQNAQVEDEISNTQLQNDSLQARVSNLDAEKRKIAGYRRELAAAREALPEQKDMSAFLRSLQSIAAATSTKVTAVTVGDPEAVTPATPAGTDPSAQPSSSASSAPDGSTGGAPGTAGAAGSGVFSIPITASVTGAPSALTAFLTQLQAHQPRAVLVTKVTRGSDSEQAGAAASLQLSMSAFVAPAAVPAAPGATAAATTPSADGGG